MVIMGAIPRVSKRVVKQRTLQLKALPVGVGTGKGPDRDSAHAQMLAFCCQHCHYACMTVQIAIRDVPEWVRDELAARAALQHKSMQEYLRAELERLASKPSLESWLNTVSERKAATGARVKATKILRARDADRK